MNEQVQKEADALIGSFRNYVDDENDYYNDDNNKWVYTNQIECAIKTQERVISELEKVFSTGLSDFSQTVTHNKEILKYLKTL